MIAINDKVIQIRSLGHSEGIKPITVFDSENKVLHSGESYTCFSKGYWQGDLNWNGEISWKG